MHKAFLMKKTVAFLVILAAGISQLFAQAPKSSLLWEVSGNGLKSPSYVFGTFHIICKSDFTVSTVLKNKIKSTKQFYGELNMSEIEGMQLQMAMKMLMKDKTIESMMDADDYKKMSDAFQKETNMSFSMFNKLKPFMSQSVLAMNMISCEDKIQPETEFAKIAKDNKLPIFGLETLDDELKAIDKIPLDSQVNDLKNMLLNFDSAKLEMRQMIDLYKKRNTDSLYKFISKSVDGSSTERELLIMRNKNWLPVIVKAMKEKSSFFAVGAGHLGGEHGILNLLRKQGYRLTPVTF
jgi:uncharacterized protein YbaP (TraB family)